MKRPEIIGLGTAIPPFRMTQGEVYERLAKGFKLSPSEDALYRRLLLDGGIKGRNFGMKSAEEILERDPEKLNARFLEHALPTAAEAARKALAEAGVEAAEIDILTLNTCTGYLCPGLSSYLAEELGLRGDLRAADIMGMGCGAALPNLECASGLLAARGGFALAVSVEICSATIYPSHEPELIVSNSIFGDGAAASVLASPERRREGAGRPLAKILDYEAGLRPESRDELRYRNKGGLLRNSLTKKVPEIGAELVAEVCERLLSRNGMKKDEIASWSVHPGGTQVLRCAGERLGLSKDDLACSYEVFKNHGNMSSPSVLFALRSALDGKRPEPGVKGILIAFGAGFSAYASLIEF